MQAPMLEVFLHYQVNQHEFPGRVKQTYPLGIASSDSRLRISDVGGDKKKKLGVRKRSKRAGRV